MVRGCRGRGTKNGLQARRSNGRGAPAGPMPYSTEAWAAPVTAALWGCARADMRSEDVSVARGIEGAEVTGDKEADAA